MLIIFYQVQLGEHWHLCGRPTTGADTGVVWGGDPLRLSAIFFCLLIFPRAGPCNNLDPLLKFLYETPPSECTNPPPPLLNPGSAPATGTLHNFAFSVGLHIFGENKILTYIFLGKISHLFRLSMKLNKGSL